MSLRSEEPGWIKMSDHDPGQRRCVWFRETRAHLGSATEASGPVVLLEVCAGREGDDAYVALKEGQVIDTKTLGDLSEALDNGRWCIELQMDGDPRDPTPEELHGAWDRLSVEERDAFAAGVGAERASHQRAHGRA